MLSVSKNKKYFIIILSFAIFIIAIAVFYISSEDINEKAILEKHDVIKLLQKNGYKIFDAQDFPFASLEFTTLEKKPSVFKMEHGNFEAYLLLYEYPNYNELKEGNDMLTDFFQGIYNQNSEEAMEFTLGIIGRRIYGKNIMMLCWDEDIDYTSSNSYYEQRSMRIDEWNKVFDIMFAQAFYGKVDVYSGESNHWELQMPVKYYVNEYRYAEEQRGREVTETTSFSKAYPKMRYKPIMMNL